MEMGQSQTDRPIRVAVAMSGGVDSSIAAALLVQQGYAVVGLTMKLYDSTSAGLSPEKVRGCCSLEAIHRAEAVCHQLNIPHYSIDLMKSFDHYVIQDFISEYINGRTPNPCVRCNTYLKWGMLFDKARMLGCQKLATGHYARLREVQGEFHLLRAADMGKDQAYALWGIPREKLPHTLFPLGDLRKSQVRELAEQMQLKTAMTPESQEICFIPDGHYVEFLQRKKPDFFARLGPGKIVELSAKGRKYSGTHPGYPFFTIGQRRGLGGGRLQPYYVVDLEPESNCVIISSRDKLLARDFAVDQLNWLIPVPDQPLRAEVQIRYRSPAYPAIISPSDRLSKSPENCFLVQFEQPVEAITPGQSAVFFRENRLLGGGRIVKVLRYNERQRSARKALPA